MVKAREVWEEDIRILLLVLEDTSLSNCHGFESEFLGLHHTSNVKKSNSHL